jgi:hypothetical protein
MAGKDTVIYGESLIGKRVWLGDMLMEVIELGDEPKSARVYVMCSKTKLELGTFSLNELKPIYSSSLTTISDDIVGQEFALGQDHIVTVLNVREEVCMGRVRVKCVTNMDIDVYADVKGLKLYGAKNKAKRGGASGMKLRLKEIQAQLATLIDETRLLTDEVRLLNGEYSDES